MDTGRAVDICREAVALSSSDDAIATMQEVREGATRFANNAITQNVAHRTSMLTVRVAFGRRRGEVRINRFDRESLRQAVGRAEAIARLTPEDDEHLPPAEPAAYLDAPSGLPATIDADPADRAEAVGRAIRAMSDGLVSTGAFSTGGTLMAFANSRGAHGAHTLSEAEVHATVIAPSSSGWAREVSRDRSEVDPERATRRARRLAELSANPREIDPGEYRVVLAPSAAAEMLAYFLFAADAREADEGRSAFTGKEGARVTAENVTLRSRVADPSCPIVPFDVEGAPVRDTTWIEGGVLRSLVTQRYWAEKSGRPHTPFPNAFTMEGTDRSEEDLIAQVDRGLYVTRFWYTRFVDPMTLLLTGMTRDGLFLIEGGKIVAGLKHLRYNDSPLRVLSSIVDVGRAELTYPYLLARVPSLLVDGFRFTSGTAF